MKVAKSGVIILAVMFITGCMGQMGLSKSVHKFNMRASSDRWPREFLFLGMYIIPVYPFAGAIDLVVINSMEFWTGTNPYTGKSPAVVDMKVSALEDAGVKNVAEATLRSDGKETVKMELIFNDGHEEMISAIKKENTFEFYHDGNLIGSVPKEKLLEYGQQNQTVLEQESIL